MNMIRPSSTVRESWHGTLFLLRHGAVQSPVDGKCYIGWQDVPLSDIGLQQARMWADYFAGAGLEEIHSSDLSRCLETARIIGASCTVEPRELRELREVCLGEWEGQGFGAVKTLFPEAFRRRGDDLANHRPPGGESFGDLQHRVWPIFETLARRCRGNTLIVTHAGVIRVLICRLLDAPLKHLFSIGQAHAAVNIIAVRPEGYRIQALNLQAPSQNHPGSYLFARP
jgi:broad specificity phosphatase PhoE